MRVRLKTLKTDPFRQGIDVFIGRTGNELCLVAVVLAYMARRGPGPALTRPRLVT